ncbi:hypothetical protein G7Y89_g10356 [Cudoniella acicularis]|uniref:Uncharacterized protein n=1 Tax=Cudoniella acicularis TaxID=354080 RepID=A0A8H4REI7_9HELO|nr:hypothetical protein G7Y89_g10356 [Cudoniella acicularis]
MGRDVMPPLDVLFIWHTFMLSLQKYLEECLRFGRMDFWATGFPWDTITACFNEDTTYNPGTSAQEVFEERTGYAWDNLNGSPVKVLLCPKDNTQIFIPWTTCDSINTTIEARDLNDIDIDTRPLGTGYAEKEFHTTCPTCSTRITHEYLQVQKFRKDAEGLVLNNYPLPGTILSPDGLPISDSPKKLAGCPRLFPNRVSVQAAVKASAVVVDIIIRKHTLNFDLDL